MHGREFPLLVQDYRYDFARNYENVFTNGFFHREDTEVIVSAIGSPEFTTVSNRYHDVLQLDKDSETISEVSPTFESYMKSYYETLPSFSIETQEGMFEYVFIRSRYVGSNSIPSTNPVITGIEITVRGNKNHFAAALDAEDIERLSFSNCNTDCEWRKLHDAGQGVLLHLSDIGLGGELESVYPFKNRIKLEIAVVSERLPAVEILDAVNIDPTDAFGHTPSFPDSNKEMRLTLIRQNQILKGDIRGMRFELLNDSLRYK
jgi:hypothetical protein